MSAPPTAPASVPENPHCGSGFIRVDTGNLHGEPENPQGDALFPGAWHKSDGGDPEFPHCGSENLHWEPEYPHWDPDFPYCAPDFPFGEPVNPHN